MTDIDLNSAKAKVVFLDDDSLDQVAYDILVVDGGERDFLDAIQKASDAMCRELVLSGEGCHYNSRRGHDVFLLKEAPLQYRVYTTG